MMLNLAQNKPLGVFILDLLADFDIIDHQQLSGCYHSLVSLAVFTIGYVHTNQMEANLLKFSLIPNLWLLVCHRAQFLELFTMYTTALSSVIARFIITNNISMHLNYLAQLGYAEPRSFHCWCSSDLDLFPILYKECHFSEKFPPSIKNLPLRYCLS